MVVYDTCTENFSGESQARRSYTERGEDWRIGLIEVDLRVGGKKHCNKHSKPVDEITTRPITHGDGCIRANLLRIRCSRERFDGLASPNKWYVKCWHSEISTLACDKSSLLYMFC